MVSSMVLVHTCPCLECVVGVVLLIWLLPVMRNSLWLWFRGQALKSATAESREPFGEP
jgi:hypothetical protein